MATRRLLFIQAVWDHLRSKGYQEMSVPDARTGRRRRCGRKPTAAYVRCVSAGRVPSRAGDRW